jgi:hypothetical protein
MARRRRSKASDQITAAVIGLMMPFAVCVALCANKHPPESREVVKATDRPPQPPPPDTAPLLESYERDALAAPLKELPPVPKTKSGRKAARRELIAALRAAKEAAKKMPTYRKGDAPSAHACGAAMQSNLPTARHLVLWAQALEPDPDSQLAAAAVHVFECSRCHGSPGRCADATAALDDLDPPKRPREPNYGTCEKADLNFASTPYYRGKDPEYHYYRDHDHDGIVCE